MEIAIEHLVELALEAGQRAVGQLDHLEAELKPDSSWVTQIDREVEGMLRARLASLHPEAGFWGEETGSDRPDARDVWVVDPIDGTTNMVMGMPVWGICIGLLREARPHLGVLHLPLLGETYWAASSHGAYRNNRRIGALAEGAIRQEDCVSISSECLALLDLKPFPGRVRNFGSAAAHVAYTARGALRAHVTRDDKLHDLAAVLCIAGEAGCRAEYLAGGAVDLRPWLEGEINTEVLLIGTPGSLAHLRAVLPPRGG
jgi:myo-inositol-1(or 4)-monophosphatase